MLNKKTITGLVISLGLLLGVLSQPVLSFAQDFYQVTRDTNCVSRTYRRGEIIPADSFNSLNACNSYLQSWITFGQENALPEGEEYTADNQTWCGGQAQFACPVDGGTECDTGYVVSSLGSCVARGADDSQYILFGDCTRNGGTVSECEELAFGGQEYMNSDEASNVQDCMDAINIQGYDFDPELCQSALNVDAYETPGSQVAYCINSFREGRRSACGEISPDDYARIQADVDGVFEVSTVTSDGGVQTTIYTDTNNNQAEAILEIKERCERTAQAANLDVDCRSFAYAAQVKGNVIDLSDVSTCLTGTLADCEGVAGSQYSGYFQNECLELGYTASECRTIFNNPNVNIHNEVFNSSSGSQILSCLEQYPFSNTFEVEAECEDMYSRVEEIAGSPDSIVSNQSEISVDVQIDTEQSAPLAVKVDQPTAVVYISANNGQTVDENQRRLKDCAAVGVSLSQCEQFMLQYPQADFRGAQIASCILKPGSNNCPGGRQQVVAQVSLSEGLSGQASIDRGQSGSQSQINAEIADCVNAGASEVDCRNIIKNNTQTPITGQQVAECIQDLGSGRICTSLRGIEEAAYSTCSELGACVDGRTCIYQGQDVLRNVGARCSDKQQVPSCEPTVDKLSENGAQGAPCCGGGLIECGSGVCNAATGLQGECTANVVAGSNASSSTQGSEAAVGVGDESRDDCSNANGLVQGTAENGFTLKCDFDGNGSFGYHQPTAYIYGNQAAGKCQVLCEDPTADVEEAARIEYQARRIAVSQVEIRRDASAADLGEKTESETCLVGTFESRFACVSLYEGVCVREDDGCYRRANSEERLNYCGDVYSSALACSRAYGEQCSIYPGKGCYAPDSVVEKAEQQYADEIAEGQSELQDVGTSIAESVGRAVGNTFGRFGVAAQNTVGTLWGLLTGAEPLPEVLPFEEERSENPDQNTVLAPENPVFDSEVEMEAFLEQAGADAEAARDTQTSDVVVTIDPFDPNQPLVNGVGLTNGQPVTNGEFQVEAYCGDQGYDARDNGIDWYCQDNEGNIVETLDQEDFDSICERTYSTAAVAVQDGNNGVAAYNWICYPAAE